jgi:phosphoribosyl 1,2-cyclic phosphodiesterase
MGLFSRDLVVCALGSGSSGNCTYVGDGHAGVLVDAGVNPKQVRLRMAEAGLEDAPIDAVLVTHEHSDHVASAAVLARALARRGKPVPFLMSAGTASNVDARCLPDGVELVVPGEPFRVRHLLVDPFPIPHDTAEPLAYRIAAGGTSVAVVTDLGKPTALVAHQLRQCAAVVLEFNHDEELLWGGPYPWPLKKRIAGPHGHLSNAQAARLLQDGLGETLAHLVLGHLSEHNNTPAHALAAAMAVLGTADALAPVGGTTPRVTVTVAPPRSPAPPLRVRAEAW